MVIFGRFSIAPSHAPQFFSVLCERDEHSKPEVGSFMVFFRRSAFAHPVLISIRSAEDAENAKKLES